MSQSDDPKTSYEHKALNTLPAQAVQKAHPRSHEAGDLTDKPCRCRLQEAVVLPQAQSQHFLGRQISRNGPAQCNDRAALTGHAVLESVPPQSQAGWDEQAPSEQLRAKQSGMF